MLLKWSRPARNKLTFTGPNNTTQVTGAVTNAQTVAAIVGPPGPPGPPGQADDVGDLTLLFDNGIL